MANAVRRNFLDGILLMAAILVPVLYFGAQLAALPFFPGYNVFRDVASVLGTGGCRQPWIFNLGAILTGVAALGGAIGLYQAFRSTTNIVISALIGTSLAATGVVSIRAGLFPMPDPRHGDWGFLSFFTVALPLLFFLGLWGKQGVTKLRVYLVASTLLVLFLLPLLTHSVAIEALQPGTVQRLLAVAAFAPVGVVGYHFSATDEKAR